MRRDRSNDDGMTLIELLVGLGILTVVMTIATGGILQVFRGINRADAADAVQSRLHVAFTTFDKEVRYAAWLRPPAGTTRYTYVEFLSAVAQTREDRCHRAVVDRTAGTLRLQSWRPGTTPDAGRALAAQLVTTGSPAVFTVFEADTAADGVTAPHQRLRIRLTARAGAGTDQRTVSSDVTFSAVNTGHGTAPGTGCTTGRPT